MRCAALVLVACGSSSAPPPKPVAVQRQPPPPAVDTGPSRDELASAHHKLEAEQQDALAATCAEKAPHEPHERCLPSCYPTEAADVRAGKRVPGAVETGHLVCEGAVPLLADELDAKLALRPVRGRFPKPHKKTTWQGALEATLIEQHVIATTRGDAVVVTGAWRALVHPLTKERLRCVAVSHFARSLRKPIDGCGADGSLGCEANGDAAARGINVVHYRVVEARRLLAAHKPAECQQAALEAIAVARGMPRWRQYAKLNVDHWQTHTAYRTRFDGTLDEDALFAATATLGTEAEQIYAQCGGQGAVTTPEAEQSFHTCW